MIKGFVKHFRIPISDVNIEQRFDDSMSSLSSSKYMILLLYLINSIMYLIMMTWSHRNIVLFYKDTKTREEAISWNDLS